MEVVEDDLLFADLSKRISLLIMDDDDDVQDSTLHYTNTVISQTTHPFHNQIIPSFHDQNGRREIRGTGVFIPQSSTNSRRSKQSRSKYSNMRDVQTQRHINSSSGHLPHEPYNNHSVITNSHNFLNHKRCY